MQRAQCASVRLNDLARSTCCGQDKREKRMINNLYLTTAHQMDASQTANQPTQEEGVNEKSNPQAKRPAECSPDKSQIRKTSSNFGQCDRRNDCQSVSQCEGRKDSRRSAPATSSVCTSHTTSTLVRHRDRARAVFCHPSRLLIGPAAGELGRATKTAHFQLKPGDGQRSLNTTATCPKEQGNA